MDVTGTQLRGMFDSTVGRHWLFSHRGVGRSEITPETGLSKLGTKLVPTCGFGAIFDFCPKEGAGVPMSVLCPTWLLPASVSLFGSSLESRTLRKA